MTTSSTLTAPSRSVEAGAGRLGPAAAALLARSDAELVAASLAPPSDRFVHAHLAALRAGAALLAVHGRPSRRPRPVWELVAATAPGLAGWAQWFAQGAALRAGVESGRAEVDAERADRTLAAAETFAGAVREVLGATEQGELGLRAS